MRTVSRTIPIGISACLVGQPVRFNGGHKHSSLCTAQLGPAFTLVPFCPEVAVGLDTPRQPIRLVGEPQAPRVLGSQDPTLDLTEPLQRYGAQVAANHPELCGFILMQKSPSCGLQRVKLYQADGQLQPKTSSGAFASALRQANPWLPIEEEGRLHDPVLRENFITRVEVYAQWRQQLEPQLSAAALLAFHARHKYLLLAHHPESYRRLGQRLANLRRADLGATAQAYFQKLMEALSRPASRQRHSNALEHIAGHFKRALNPAEKHELSELIGHYRQGLVPLVVPITLLKHHLLKHPDSYLQQQSYLQPHPPELSLRNAI